MYAIGGSADPTIFSEGNYFVAPDDSSKKQVPSFKISHVKNIMRSNILYKTHGPVNSLSVDFEL